MVVTIRYVSLLVNDQEEALRYYRDTLGFVKTHDQTVDEFRWLVVSPDERDVTGLVLIQAVTSEEKKAVGEQSGGRYPLLIITTTDFNASYQSLIKRGVEFIGEPMENPWGKAVQLKDLYGNKIELMQPVVPA